MGEGEEEGEMEGESEGEGEGKGKGLAIRCVRMLFYVKCSAMFLYKFVCYLSSVRKSALICNPVTSGLSQF
jgi:hypothetical protein